MPRQHEPVDEEALFEALRDNFSPEAVAAMAVGLERLGATSSAEVDRQLQWFARGLVDMLGGHEAARDLAGEIGL